MAINKIDVYEKNLARIHEWIRSVDQKISIFLTLQMAVLVFLVPLVSTFYKNTPSSFTLLVVVLLLESLFLFLYSTAKSIIGLYARLRVKRVQISEDLLSLTFFKHIESMTLEAYEKKMEKMSPGDYRRELLNQIHVSAKISVKKHENFNDAVLLFVAAVALFAFAFIDICF